MLITFDNHYLEYCTQDSDSSGDSSEDDNEANLVREQFDDSIHVQELSFGVESYRGGWKIVPPLDRFATNQTSVCSFCHFQNGGRRLSRVMFGFTMCSHTLCDSCIRSFYCMSADEDVDPNGCTRNCPKCGEKLGRTVFIPMDGLTLLPAPLPFCFLGKKAVYSHSLANCLYPFYKREIDFFVSGWDNVPKKMSHVQDQISSCNHPKKRVELLECMDALSALWSFMRKREQIVKFALDGISDFPRELLELNDTYYTAVLDHSKFTKLQRDAGVVSFL